MVLRLSWRLSGIVADCLGVSCRCQGGLCTVSDCLGVSCWYLGSCKWLVYCIPLYVKYIVMPPDRVAYSS
ncbi:hypothetical protein DPMN_128549 [Dreissena polymorpha]|uniref:Uncharacterized protein n=1 Tax=Dreissena polymorpha TaxID=45954 RepID=A0A9D4JVV0_DREPO|nr:hypothetical protein DPMN_128549 [Dreissena polymorpha]